jgi:hypothetical protein
MYLTTHLFQAWPAGCQLRFTGGHKLDSEVDFLPVGCLGPWQKTDLSLRMRSPAEAGIYESHWRMSTHTGDFFGDVIWVILTVEPAGTLALTQQLSNFHELGGSHVATRCAGGKRAPLFSRRNPTCRTSRS